MRSRWLRPVIWLAVASALMACEPDQRLFFDGNNQLPSNTISGSYRGELRLYADTSSSPLAFSPIAGLIDDERRFRFGILDSIGIEANGAAIVRLDSLDGILGSEGDFWGGLRLSSGAYHGLRATGAPIALANQQLDIWFVLDSLLGTQAIDSVHCILNQL